MTITAIQTVTIPVADQDRSLAFYTDVLGFEVRADNAYGDARWLTVAPAGASTEFVLHPPLPGFAAGSSAGTVLVTDDITTDCAALTAAGFRVDGPESVGWGQQAQFSDPDGNGFVLVQQGGQPGA
jgi:catechol 2,3-dioxygenase-like lactoylglutathione lyase family enzyme